MAVTYSWRIDTNKYAYIVPPGTITGTTNGKGSGISTTDWNNYGFLSETPLTDYFARNVATSAEQRFGAGAGSSGKTEYMKAFDSMYRKIKAAGENDYKQKLSGENSFKTFNWSGMQNADLLSADMYYDVDAAQCADLRGVGIKGVRYLGSQIPQKTYVDFTFGNDESGVNLDNMSYIPSGQTTTIIYKNSLNIDTTQTITVRPGIPGAVDVYGIFMNDQTDNEGNISNVTPESIFVIRNAKDGARGGIGETGSAGANGVQQTALDAVLTQVESLTTIITNLEASIQTLLSSYNGLLSNGYDGFLTRVGQTENDITTIRQQIQEISGNTGNGNNTGGGDYTGGGSIEIIKLGGRQPEGNTLEGENLNLNLNQDTVYLLGYLMNDDNDEVDATTVQAKTLFALPYLRVNGRQITFDGDLYVDKKIQGKEVRSLENTCVGQDLIVQNQAYSSQGFYQEENTDGFGTDVTKQTDFTGKSYN